MLISAKKATITPSVLLEAKNFLSIKYGVKKKFLKFVGIMDSSSIGRKFALFNILDPKHRFYKSTKGYEMAASIAAGIVTSLINRPRELKNFKVNRILYSMAKKSQKVTGGHNVLEVLKEEDKGPYILRTERVDSFPDTEPITWTMAYTKDGSYIGDPETATFLFENMGLSWVEKAKKSHQVCSIGFNESEQRWYGYSHRAIVGFGIGDRIYEEDYGDDNTSYVKHGEKVIKTLDDAKLSAIRFAEHVS